MKIKFGISSCPNDTFMFEALINSKIDTHDLDFEFVIEDIKRLNNLSIKNKLDVSKISFGAFFSCMYNYEFVRSGAALGFGCGPLIIQKKGSIIKRIVDLFVPKAGQGPSKKQRENGFFKF